MSTKDAPSAILQAALHSMGQALFIVARDGRIVFFSTRAEEMTGLRAADLLGRSCADLQRYGLCGIPSVVSTGAIWDPREVQMSVRNKAMHDLHCWTLPLRDPGGTLLGTVIGLHASAIQVCTTKTPPGALVGFGASGFAQTFMGHSPAACRIIETIRRLGPSDASVLIMGESGTGKELIARSIHEASRRRSRAMVAINCAAIPHGLLESELFGHVRGAFTGAVRDRHGAVELTAGGTLFLDEIGDLPLSLQAKLLRLLQERTYQRVGDSRTMTADLRIVAATNVDLEQAVALKRFRQDLYFRLCVIPIRVPPLRERREDIAPLATFLLARRSVEAGRRPMRFDPAALRVLERATWEGNVRQLINVIDYVIALCDSTVVEVPSLPPGMGDSSPEPQPGRHGRYRPIQRGEAEANLIRTTLAAQGYHRQRTAGALGMDRVTLYRKIRNYGISVPPPEEGRD